MSFNYKESLIDRAINYQSYRQLIDSLLEQHQTTGENNTAELVHYTRLNVQRMRRLDKTVTLSLELNQALAALKETYLFLVLTEGWCGDASQIVPVFNHIAEASAGKISLRLLFRDENLELMDQYLTNGTRSIPKLIVLNQQMEVKATWGPRPAVLHELIKSWRAEGTLSHDEWAERAHAWYAADRTRETQQELAALLRSL